MEKPLLGFWLFSGAAFGRDIPNYYGGRNGDRAYGRLITSSLESIAKEIERDLEQGIRDNDYVQDENADKLKEALKELERCGVRCYSLEKKVDDLAWFVGGDPEKIRQLQQKLNELGLGERLKEDGVFGRKTKEILQAFVGRLLHETFTTLAWVDPLQSERTGIVYKRIDTPDIGSVAALMDVSDRNKNIKKNIKRDVVVFRADKHLNPPYDYPHINTVNGNLIYGKKQRYFPTDKQLKNINAYNHKRISETAYKLLKDFDGTAKKVRIGNRVLLFAGAALDALELYQAIEPELQDADRKLEKKTKSTIASIIGSWSLSFVGASYGAAWGASVGTAIMPGVGTAIGGIVGGIIGGAFGSAGGDWLGQWVVDITVLEE